MDYNVHQNNANSKDMKCQSIRRSGSAMWKQQERGNHYGGNVLASRSDCSFLQKKFRVGAQHEWVLLFRLIGIHFNDSPRHQMPDLLL